MTSKQLMLGVQRAAELASARKIDSTRHKCFVSYHVNDVDEVTAVVPEEAVGIAVLIGDKEIEIAVAVDVEPDRADGFARVADARFDGDIDEAAVIVAKQTVRLVAECYEQIEVTIVVVIDPRHLTRNPGQIDAERTGDVREVTPVAIVAIELVRRPVDEAEVEIDVTVGVEIAPRGSAGFHVVGQANGGRDILEAAAILLIETIRTAAKADELVEISVVVDISPRVRLTAGDAEEFRLNKLESRLVGGEAI